MKKASIITIGNELLSGRTIDTNAAYLGSQLLCVGIPVAGSYTVPDEMDPIVHALNLACDDADIIVITGGLGPTDDDLTRQALAKFLDTDLQLNNELLRKIMDFFDRRNRPMPATNKIQAYIPKGAEAIANALGTAPGIFARKNEKLFFALPGVPLEMKRMFEESVLPYLKDFAAGQVIVVKRLNCFGAGESKIQQMLGSLLQRGRNPLINSTVAQGVITLHIIATAADKNLAEQMVENDRKLLTNLLGDLVFGTDDQTLAEVVGKKLAQEKKTLAVAESCTGGCLAMLITDVPGASAYFTQGWVVYSNDAKIIQLGVDPALIKKHGAVSEEVASAMAKGARKNAKTDFTIAITGIAGPAGGTKEKPVGLVYIALDCDAGTVTKKCIFPYDRPVVRRFAALTALDMLRHKFRI
jgi:nicotinamide-nucleotide amidase